MYAAISTTVTPLDVVFGSMLQIIYFKTFILLKLSFYFE